MACIVGIDLGTTNSLVARCEGVQPIVIPNAFGHTSTPSVVHFGPQGQLHIGHAAVPYCVLAPESTIFGAKRFIGRKFNEVFDIAARMPYRVDIDENHLATFELGERRHLPQVVSALVLRSLRHAAEVYFGTPVEKAVVTVPAYFTAVQRQATLEAGTMAGLEIVRLIEEPTAAAMAARIDPADGSYVAVLDLGGGTFDVTLLEAARVDDEVQYEVLSISGDGFLGGDDFTERLAQWLEETIEYESGGALALDATVRNRFRDAAERAKLALSDQSTVEIALAHFPLKRGGTTALKTLVSRALFEDLCSDLIDRLHAPIREVMRRGGIAVDELAHVILVGGASRMPCVARIAETLLARRPTVPVNPFEAIARGAAIQASVLEGNRKDVLLVNVTPHSLGIELADGTSRMIIRRDTTIPTKYGMSFRLATPTSKTVELRVLEGEGSLAHENRCLLGTHYDGITSPEVVVTLDIDANHGLHVELSEPGTGQTFKSIVHADTSLSADKVCALTLTVESLWAASLVEQTP